MSETHEPPRQGGVIEPSGIPLVSDDPGPEVVYLPKNATVTPVPFLQSAIEHIDMNAMRKAIDDAIQRALHPGGTISAQEYRRIEMSDQDGKRWRGMLYRVDEDTPPHVPVTGICWACARPGGNMQMEWHGQHLIHATDECRILAQSKPEQREHRG